MTFLCLACAATPRLTRGMAALPHAYGSIARTCCLSVACTSAVPRKWRLFLVVFLVRMWRLNACERLMLPLPRTLKRFLAARLVFILGMTTPVLIWRWVAPGRDTLLPGHHLLWPYLAVNSITYFFFGDSTITICRPSILGNCSTTP